MVLMNEIARFARLGGLLNYGITVTKVKPSNKQTQYKYFLSFFLYFFPIIANNISFHFISISIFPSYPKEATPSPPFLSLCISVFFSLSLCLLSFIYNPFSICIYPRINPCPKEECSVVQGIQYAIVGFCGGKIMGIAGLEEVLLLLLLCDQYYYRSCFKLFWEGEFLTTSFVLFLL